MDKEKQLKKVHGGAVSNGFNIHSDQNREIFEYENKSVIAKKGVSLLNHGDVVLITGGSTNLELAKLLPKKMKRNLGSKMGMSVPLWTKMFGRLQHLIEHTVLASEQLAF